VPLQSIGGVTGASGLGNISPAQAFTLTGNAATSAAGTITAGSALTVAITGVNSTGAVGSVGVSRGAILSGAAATGNVGTVSLSTSFTVAITGNSATGAVGSLGMGVTAGRLKLISGAISTASRIKNAQIQSPSGITSGKIASASSVEQEDVVN
jgi:hypothetical protein